MISATECEAIQSLLKRFYGEEGEVLSNLEKEVLIFLMDKELKDQRKQLASMRGA